MRKDSPQAEVNTVSKPDKYSLIIKGHNIKLALKNPIVIQKLLSAVTEYPAKNIRGLGNGDLVVTCADEQQKIKLLKIKTLGEYKVSVKEPVSSNKSEGVIYGVSTELTEVDTVDNLKDIGVFKAIRMKGKQYENSENSTTVRLVFNTKELPESVALGYRTYTVKLYIPPPLRCYNCNRYGHIAVKCKGKQRCQKCGGDHKVIDCGAEIKKCVNCGGAHSDAYGGCTARTKAVDIVKIQVTEHCSRREAVQEYKKKSYAQSVSENTPEAINPVPYSGVADFNIPKSQPDRPSVRPSVTVTQEPVVTTYQKATTVSSFCHRQNQ
ncbi:uncharacterized protein LOC117343018 [Pecten maximus]|uniref:uncharacterized protein LOC117343018 n=1 Tax=Pecten maximus TaxID=6579 RepID=UPI001458B866|nr:uncharacterized protein LOC117343018 [Pecten maximus]